jgi:hypothetical protein
MMQKCFAILRSVGTRKQYGIVSSLNCTARKALEKSVTLPSISGFLCVFSACLKATRGWGQEIVSNVNEKHMITIGR